MGADLKRVFRDWKASLVADDHRKGHLGVGEGREGGCHRAVPSDEPSVKIGKAQKMLKLLTGVRSGPGGDSRDPGRVHLDGPPPYDVPQEGDRRNVELTFLNLDEK